MRTTSCGACARADAKADRTGTAEATARRRRLVRMRSDMAPLLRACAPCGGAGAYSGIRRREGSAQASRQLMQRTPRRQSMLGTEAWDIAVSMDFRCFSNARVHALEQWMRLPKLRGPKQDAPQFPKRTKGFSPGAAAHASRELNRERDRVRCASRKSWQAIDASDPSGTGGGRTLSPEQRQKRQCAFLARRLEGQVHAMPSSARNFRHSRYFRQSS